MIRRIASSYEAAPQLVEDLVQDIYIAIWKSLPSFRGDASVRTFVARIATNRAITHVARARRLPPMLELSESIPCTYRQPRTPGYDRRPRPATGVGRAVIASGLSPNGHARVGRTDPEGDRRRARHYGKCSGHPYVEGQGTASPIDGSDTMSKPPDEYYWDELGVAWCAVSPEIDAIVPRLTARLRRQSMLMTAAGVVGLPLSVAGLLLGMLTIWSGWTTGMWNFVTRGTAVAAMSVLAASALSLLLSARASDATRALSDMLDLAVTRSERMLVLIRFGLYACIVAAVFGVVGTVIRTHIAAPPQMSPIVDVAILALAAVGLLLYARHTKATLARLRALKHALTKDGVA
jgi:hypothetical protein